MTLQILTLLINGQTARTSRNGKQGSALACDLERWGEGQEASSKSDFSRTSMNVGSQQIQVRKQIVVLHALTGSESCSFLTDKFCELGEKSHLVISSARLRCLWAHQSIIVKVFMQRMQTGP